MSTEKGNLSINSENIFPIIKKWLYSDHDIFYRELISNGCDAITKLTNEIEELNVKILYEKGLKLCPNCRTENNLEYTFCFKCGSRFDEKPAQPDVEVAAEEKVEEAEAAPETSENEEKPEESSEE